MPKMGAAKPISFFGNEISAKTRCGLESTSFAAADVDISRCGISLVRCEQGDSLVWVGSCNIYSLDGMGIYYTPIRWDNVGLLGQDSGRPSWKL